MNIVRADLPERLAAEYVLGTLRGGARRRFEALLPAHPALRHAVAGWEQRLLPMALRGPALAPPAALWPRIEARLGWAAAAAEAAAPVGRPAAALPAGAPGAAQGASARALRFWRAFSALAALAALMLGILLRSAAPAAAPLVVVLRAANGGDVLVAGVSPDRRQLSIQPVQPVALTTQQSLELWAVPAQGAPASLGLIAADGLTAISRQALPVDTAALAVSLEPAGGSPTGAPTGPVLFVGKLTL